MYEYQASLMEVIDGDTIDMTVDLGFRIHREIRLRLRDVDTHETHGVSESSTEYRKGIEEKRFVQEWLQQGTSDDVEWPFVIATEKKGKFGRYLAEVERASDGAVLNEDLVDKFGDAIRLD